MSFAFLRLPWICEVCELPLLHLLGPRWGGGKKKSCKQNNPLSCANAAHLGVDIEVFIAFKTLLLTLSIVEQETFLNDEEPLRQRKEINSVRTEVVVGSTRTSLPN